jgi:putative membrane protein
MNGWDMGGNWIGMSLAMGFGVVLVVLIAMLIARGSTTGPNERTEDALSVLRRRFAAGEIDETEYQRRREILGV